MRMRLAWHGAARALWEAQRDHPEFVHGRLGWDGEHLTTVLQWTCRQLHKFSVCPCITWRASVVSSILHLSYPWQE